MNFNQDLNIFNDFGITPTTNFTAAGLDFYIPKLSIAIECQGKQHFIGSELWESLDALIKRDRHKNEVCKKNGIEIIYVIDKNYSVMDSMYSKENTCNIKNLENVLNFKLK